MEGDKKMVVPSPESVKPITEAATAKQKVTSASSRLNFDQIKCKLCMSPSVPKNKANFNSYVQNKFKVTDPELWSFAQSINCSLIMLNYI